MNLWNDWLSLILSDLEQSQRERFVDPSTGEVPAWVTKIDAELEKMLFPVRLAEDEKPTPKKVGALLGQTYAYYGWILDCMRKPSSALSTRFAKGVEEFLEEDFSADFAAEITTMADQGYVFALVKFQHVLKRALGLVVERPFMEAADFFDGFTGAVLRRSRDSSIWTDKFSTASAYYVLRRQWEFVETFRNVSDLHIFLQHKLGRGAAGDLDRTRSLAKRLQLRLAPRGRPSKKWVKVPK
jgi:hypothetical protein